MVDRAGYLDVLQGACAHGSYNVWTTDFTVDMPTLASIPGAFQHESCTYCGATTTVCRHLESDQDSTGLTRSCVICSADTTDRGNHAR